MSVQSILPLLQLILTFGNICIIGYAFVKFIGRPHSSLESRVTTLEVKYKEIEERLNLGQDHFRALDAKSEVFMECMLAFIDFEIAFCQKTGYTDIEDIKSAKKTLTDYLKKK